jgi:hypothetical protein
VTSPAGDPGSHGRPGDRGLRGAHPLGDADQRLIVYRAADAASRAALDVIANITRLVATAAPGRP